MSGNVFKDYNSLVPKKYINLVARKGLELSNLYNGSEQPYYFVGNNSSEYLGDVDIAIDPFWLEDQLGANKDNFWDKIEEHLGYWILPYKINKGLNQIHLLVPLIDEKNNRLNSFKKMGKNGDVYEDDTSLGWVQLDIFIGNVEWMKKALTQNSKIRNLFLTELVRHIIFPVSYPKVHRRWQIIWTKGVEWVDFIYDLRNNKPVKFNRLPYIENFEFFIGNLFGYENRKVDTFEKMFELFMSDGFRFDVDKKLVIENLEKTLKKQKLGELNDVLATEDKSK